MKELRERAQVIQKERLSSTPIDTNANTTLEPPNNPTHTTVLVPEVASSASSSISISSVSTPSPSPNYSPGPGPDCSFSPSPNCSPSPSPSPSPSLSPSFASDFSSATSSSISIHSSPSPSPNPIAQTIASLPKVPHSIEIPTKVQLKETVPAVCAPSSDKDAFLEELRNRIALIATNGPRKYNQTVSASNNSSHTYV